MGIMNYLSSILSPKNVRDVTLTLLWNSDTTTVRVILALASLLFSITVFTQEAKLVAPAWWSVSWHLASPEVWSAAFMLHFLGLSWRFLDPVPRVVWALVINSFGLLIWTANTLALNVATWREYGTVSPTTALEVTVCIFAAWALFRTGQQREILNP